MRRELNIGTLLRLAQITEERVNFLRTAGLEGCQLAGIYEEYLSLEGREKSDRLIQLLRKNGLEPDGIFLSYPNQDWEHPETGIGIVPEKTRAERMVLSCRQMNWGKRYGIGRISCHVGVVPEPGSEFYGRLISDLRQLAAFALENGQEFLFETGPEPVALLKQTFKDIGMPNVGINFDPANLLIYDQDDPADLLRELPEYVRLVHCKDAVRPTEKGKLGRETVLGKGATGFSDLMKTLLCDIGFRGPLIIERELQPGPEQEKDIAEAVVYLNNRKKELGIKPA